MKTFLALILVLFISYTICYGEILIYKESAEDGERTHKYQIESDSTGYKISATISGEETLETHVVVTDSAGATIKWRYTNSERETDVKAYRQENVIYLKGSDKDGKIDEKFDIDSRPWHEFFPLDLEQFAISHEKEMEFWAIGTFGPGYMKITDFIAKRKETDTIEFGSDTVEAVRIQVHMKGWKSIFWKGNYWFRKSDGRYLWYENDEEPIKLIEVEGN